MTGNNPPIGMPGQYLRRRLARRETIRIKAEACRAAAGHARQQTIGRLFQRRQNVFYRRRQSACRVRQAVASRTQHFRQFRRVLRRFFKSCRRRERSAARLVNGGRRQRFVGVNENNIRVRQRGTGIDCVADVAEIAGCSFQTAGNVLPQTGGNLAKQGRMRREAPMFRQGFQGCSRVAGAAANAGRYGQVFCQG